MVEKAQAHDRNVGKMGPHHIHILVRRTQGGRSRCSSLWSPRTPPAGCRTCPGRRLQGQRGQSVEKVGSLLQATASRGRLLWQEGTVPRAPGEQPVSQRGCHVAPEQATFHVDTEGQREPQREGSAEALRVLPNSLWLSSQRHSERRVRPEPLTDVTARGWEPHGVTRMTSVLALLPTGDLPVTSGKFLHGTQPAHLFHLLPISNLCPVPHGEGAEEPREAFQPCSWSRADSFMSSCYASLTSQEWAVQSRLTRRPPH